MQRQPIIPQIRRRSDSVSSDSSVECIAHIPASEESRVRNREERRRRLGIGGILQQVNEPRRQPAPGPADVIVIDSDDDEPLLAGGSTFTCHLQSFLTLFAERNAPVHTPRAALRRNRLNSPPPPRQDNHIPPLPNVNYLMLPRPRAHNGGTPIPGQGPIHPVNAPRDSPVQVLSPTANLPFDFEANAQHGPGPRAIPQALRRDPSYPPPRPAQAHRNQPQPFPEVAPPPRVGLGGGLIGGGGAHPHVVQHHHHHHHPPVQEAHLPLHYRLVGGHAQPQPPPRARLAHYVQNLPIPLLRRMLGEGLRGAGGILGDFGLGEEIHLGAAREESPDYKPEWTHAQKPEPGFSNTFEDETTTIILDNGGTREEKSNRGICPSCRQKLVTNGSDEDGNRIYGLRCGHMIDARCFKRLTRPGNGLPVVDRKGKGKAREDYYESDGGNQPQPGGSGSPYQLRNRTAAQRETVRKKPAKGRRGKKRGPVITAQHLWKCPLFSCQMAHMSVQYDDNDEWMQDKERGAIAMFV
jgi:hypothetical protein